MTRNKIDQRAKDLKNSAFTLIELLVVVTIIAILSTLLMVVVNQVRYQARNTVCAIQLRQWGVSLLAYAGDNRGWFPRHQVREGTGQNTWDVAFEMYDCLVKDYELPPRILICPFAMPEKNINAYIANMMTYNLTNGLVGIEYSYWVQRSDKYATYPAASVAAPSRTAGSINMDVPLMTDKCLIWNGGGFGSHHNRLGDFPTNQLFIDGHVASVRRSLLINQWYGNGGICQNFR